MRFLWIAIPLLLGGCAALTPPPVLLGHGSPRAGSPGSTDLHAGGQVGSGYFVPVVLAGGFRARHQLSESLALGGQLDGGMAPVWEDESFLDDDEGRRVTVGGASGRLFAHIHASQGGPRLAVGLGGGGASTGLRYGTADLSLFFGTTGETVRVYGGPLAAVSVPIVRGRLVDGQEALASVYGMGAVGIEFSLSSRLTFSIDLSSGWAANGDDNALLFAAGSALGLQIPGS